MTCLALATLASIPVSNHIVAYNERVQAMHPDSVFFLHVIELTHWIGYGIIAAEEYEQAMEYEFEKEMRKASYDDQWVENEQEPEPEDPMAGWFI